MSSGTSPKSHDRANCHVEGPVGASRQCLRVLENLPQIVAYGYGDPLCGVVKKTPLLAFWVVIAKYLVQAANPHILTLSPPLDMQAKWFAPYVAYTMAKFGMSMCTLGMAEEFKGDGIACNSLWPRTIIATAALQMIPGVDPETGRTPDIMADAAHAILCRDSASCTGNFFVDDQVLAEEGVTDLDKYAVNSEKELFTDIFLD